MGGANCVTKVGVKENMMRRKVGGTSLLIIEIEKEKRMRG